jgi:hypothetical protein
MKKYCKLVIVFLIACTLIISGGIVAQLVNGSDDKPMTTEFAKMLIMQQDYINNGKEVPKDLKDKIALETEYNKTLKVESEKRKQEVAQLEQNRTQFEQKSKSNPNNDASSVTSVKQGFDLKPSELIKITIKPEDGKVATVFGEEAYNNMKYTSQADTSYNMLLAGADAKDSTIGVIFNKQYSKVSFDVTYGRQTYPGKGLITFESFANKNTIIVFNYGNGEKGYYDTENNKAVFQPYKS